MALKIWIKLLSLTTILLFPAAYAAERIYLMAGQSNMMGLAKTANLEPAIYHTTPTNVTFYYKGRQRPLAKGPHFGPEVSFAHQMARTFPEDQHIIVKFAATGSHIQQWFPGETFYIGMMRQLGFSIKQENPEIAAIFWMQGEGDALNHSRASQYANRLNRFIYTLRRDLKAPITTPFIMGEVDPIGRDFPMADLVRQNQHKVNAQVPGTILTLAEGIDKIYDHIHYSAAGQVELGKRFADAYIKHLQQRAQ